MFVFVGDCGREKERERERERDGKGREKKKRIVYINSDRRNTDMAVKTYRAM